MLSNFFTGHAMTENWPEGYFVNIPYTKGYYREMAPAYLRFCLLLKGVPPISIIANWPWGMGIRQTSTLRQMMAYL